MAATFSQSYETFPDPESSGNGKAYSASSAYRSENYQPARTLIGTYEVNNDILDNVSDYWKTALEGVVRRLTWGRFSGTQLYAWVEAVVPRAFQKNAEGQWKNTGVGYDFIRKGADAADDVLDFIMGDGNDKYRHSQWEITEKGWEELNWKGLLRYHITEADIVKGYFRPRRYTMNAQDMEAVHAIDRLQHACTEGKDWRNKTGEKQINEWDFIFDEIYRDPKEAKSKNKIFTSDGQIEHLPIYRDLIEKISPPSENSDLAAKGIEHYDRKNPPKLSTLLPDQPIWEAMTTQERATYCRMTRSYQRYKLHQLINQELEADGKFAEWYSEPENQKYSKYSGARIGGPEQYKEENKPIHTLVGYLLKEYDFPLYTKAAEDNDHVFTETLAYNWEKIEQDWRAGKLPFENEETFNTLSTIRDFLLEREFDQRLEGKNKSWGVYQMCLGTGFALMGLLDFSVHRIMLRFGRVGKWVDRMFSRDGEKQNAYEHWKEDIGAKGVAREVAEVAKEIGIDAIAGDGLYDFAAGSLYATVKEWFGRQTQGIERQIEMDRNGKINVIKQGSGLKDAHKLFDIPFSFYNYVGKFLWQDLCVDWWLRKDRSKLRQYMHDNAAAEDLGIIKRTWNSAVNFTSFFAVRTTQIWSWMLPSATLGFSPGAYYGKNAQAEMKLVRKERAMEHMLLAAIDGIAEQSEHSEFVKSRILGNQPENVREALYDLRTLVNKREKELNIQCKKSGYIENKGEWSNRKQAILDVLQDKIKVLEERVRIKNIKATRNKLEEKIWQAEIEYYTDYLEGKHPFDGFASEFNDPNNPKNKQVIDTVADVAKQFTDFHSTILRKVYSKFADTSEVTGDPNSEEYLSDLRERSGTIKRTVKIADDAAASYLRYAPYFALKDALQAVVEGNPLLLKPVQWITGLSHKFTWGTPKSKVALELAQQANLEACAAREAAGEEVSDQCKTLEQTKQASSPASTPVASMEEAKERISKLENTVDTLNQRVIDLQVTMANITGVGKQRMSKVDMVTSNQSDDHETGPHLN